jgi:hypothetical protein
MPFMVKGNENARHNRQDSFCIPLSFGRKVIIPLKYVRILLFYSLIVGNHMNRMPKMREYTKKDFDRTFPDDATCLEWLKRYLYPDGIFCKKCKRVTKHHRITSRPSYCCDYCGHHVHPTACTIFHRSSTRLTTWFYTVYRTASTRCGISAKQIERETGVTYKTAWRMVTRIRSMLADGSPNWRTRARSQTINRPGVSSIRMSAEKMRLRQTVPGMDSARPKKTRQPSRSALHER